jgi:hypothetical protein
MEVVGSVFTGRGKPGDFAWMIERPEYADVLFVFNDNEEQFAAHRRDPTDPRGCIRGGGNAAIRPYRCTDPVRAAGIPTGVRGAGYPGLTDETRRVIDEAVSVVRGLLASGRYRRLVYSAADGSGRLGTGIFEVGDDVKAYIVQRLRGLAS